MRDRHRREASTREKVVQVILGLLMFVLFTLLSLAVFVFLVKEEHLGQRPATNARFATSVVAAAPPGADESAPGYYI
jgi:hypothetical protein